MNARTRIIHEVALQRGTELGIAVRHEDGDPNAGIDIYYLGNHLHVSLTRNNVTELRLMLDKIEDDWQ